MRPRWRTSLPLFLFVFMALALPLRAEKKVLRVGVTTPPLTLDPAQTSDGVSGLVCAQIYEAPYEVSPGALVAEPRLFSTPLRVDGPLVRSAPLRRGARFSDGTPVTPAAAAASLSRVKWLASKASVRAEGDRVVFRLKEKDGLNETFLSLYFCGVALEKGGKLLGSGPYMPAPGASLTAMVLVRNPTFPRPAPIDEIRLQVYRPLADGSVAGLVNAVKRHDVDFTSSVPLQQAAALKRTSDVVVNVSPGRGIRALFMNLEKPGPLQERPVRLAIAKAIDRAELSRRLFSGDPSFAARNALPPALAAGDPDGLAYDPSAARDLLASRGAEPVTLALLEIASIRSVCDAIADSLGKVGFRVKSVPAGGIDAYAQRLARGDFDLAVSGLNAGTPDPMDFLEALSASWSISLPKSPCSVCANVSRFRNASLDGAFRAYHERRGPEPLHAALRTLREELPFVPLLNGATVATYSTRVKGYRPIPVLNFANLDL